MYYPINKAGSRLARKYFKNLDPERKTSENVGYSEHFKHPDSGFYQLQGMHVNEALKRFRPYVKVVMVRHPLQRFVSAYYEVVFSGHNVEKASRT